MSKKNQFIHKLRPDLQVYLESFEQTIPHYGRVLLNKNENPYDLEFTRYPKVNQDLLKKHFSTWKKVGEDQIFLSNGVLDGLDFLCRLFCQPKVDQLQWLNPIDRDLRYVLTIAK